MNADTPVLPGFDYGSLAPDVRTTVQTATRCLHDLERRTSESIIEMGQHLIDVKAAIGHGNFLPWLEAEFGWTRQTAHNLMQVAERFANVKSFDISPSALYILAAPSTPDAVRVEFTDLAAMGEQVRHKDVKAAIEREKGQAPKPSTPRAEPIPVDDWDDDEEPEEVPYEIVDRSTGEIIPPMSRNHSMSFAPAPPMTYPTEEQEAGRIAADIRSRYTNDVALKIADAIYAQCGAKRGAE